MSGHQHPIHSFPALSELIKTVESMSPQERLERKDMLDQMFRHIDLIYQTSRPRPAPPRDEDGVARWEEARRQHHNRQASMGYGYGHDDDSIIDVPEEDIEEIR